MLADFFKNWKWTHSVLAAFGLTWYVALEIAQLPPVDSVIMTILAVDKTVLQFIPGIAVALGLLTGSAISKPVAAELPAEWVELLKTLSALTKNVHSSTARTEVLATPVLPIPAITPSVALLTANSASLPPLMRTLLPALSGAIAERLGLIEAATLAPAPPPPHASLLGSEGGPILTPQVVSQNINEPPSPEAL